MAEGRDLSKPLRWVSRRFKPFFVALKRRSHQFPKTVKSPASSIRRALTHAGFFAGGLALGFVVWSSIDSSDEEAASLTISSSGKEARASGRRQERPEAFRNGTEILKAVAPHIFQERESNRQSRSMSYVTYLQSLAKQILAEADKLAPADDVAAAAISLLEKSERQRRGNLASLSSEELEELRHLNARIVHWLRADPAAALRHLSNQPGHVDTSSPIFAMMSEVGTDKAIGWLKDSDPPLGGNIRSILAMFVGSSGDLQQLEKLKESFPPAQWNSMQIQLSYSWPMEKADELFSYAIANQSPLMAVRLARARGKEGTDWLIKQVAAENLDPVFKEAITSSQEFQQMMRVNPHIPLEQRLEIIAKGEPNKDKEQLALELGSRDVSKALDDASRDWRFAFRSGKVTFEEVYEAVVADLPELAAGSPDAIRLQVFKELAEENGTAALEALAHTPEPDKWALALKPAQWMYHGVDPQKFYDYLQNIPANDPALYQARLESWVWHSAGNLAAYSRDYVDWVKAMPEGVDREMAAIGILRSVTNNSNQALKAEVDALVRDPALRARIQAPPPTKK
jgi:hypothetical protein